MNIKLFGFSFDLEIIILIGIVYLIIVVHTISNCCSINVKKLKEGLEMLTPTIQIDETNVNKDDNKKETKETKETNETNENSLNETFTENELLAVKEPFVGANTNYGQSSQFDLINSVSSSAPYKPMGQNSVEFSQRKQQILPLQEGELDFLANVDFKPDCCPNTYSNSMGCACLTMKDYNYLITRGSNNVPYSEY